MIHFKFLDKIINKFKKEEKIKMEIEIPNELSVEEFKKIMSWLQSSGFSPVVKGKGDGNVFVKLQEKKTEEQKEVPEVQEKPIKIETYEPEEIAEVEVIGEQPEEIIIPKKTKSTKLKGGKKQ